MKKMSYAFIGVLILYLWAMPSLLCGAEYTLDDLYRIALKQAEKIKVSEENVTIAKLDVNKARGALVPNLSAYGTYNQYTESKRGDTGNVIQPSQSATWGVQLAQSYSLSGREFTVLDIAGKTVEKSRYDLASFQQDYLLSVSASFYDLLRAKQALEIANANLERLTKYRDAANTRLRVGEVTKTALLRAEGELSGAQSDKIKATNTLEAAKVVLARLVGIEGPYDIQETFETEDNLGALTDLERQAIDRRQDLKSLQAQKIIAEKQLTYAKGAYWPSLSLGAAYARVDQYPQNATFNRDTIYANAAVNFTFYDGGERSADIMQAETRLRQAGLIYRDAVNSATLQVRNAFLDYTTQQGIIKFLRDQLAYGRDNFNAVSKQYEFGLSNSLDVLDANNLLLSSQRQLADALNSSRFSRLNLLKATGGLLGETTAAKQ
jgi:outer membrane protein TolC